MSNTHPARLEARRRTASLLVFEALAIALFVWLLNSAWEVNEAILVLLVLPTLFSVGIGIVFSFLVEAEEIIKLCRKADEQEYKIRRKEG